MSGDGQKGQAVAADSLTIGSLLEGAIVSSVMYRPRCVRVDPDAGTVRNLCAGPVEHHAVANLSSNKMANWVLASHHSRGGVVHSPATRRKTRHRSFIAASSAGKRPHARTARRNFAFKDSTALVSGMKIPAPILRLGYWWFRRMVRPSGIEAPGAPSAGRPFYAMNRDFWLAKQASRKPLQYVSRLSRRHNKGALRTRPELAARTYSERRQGWQLRDKRQ